MRSYSQSDCASDTSAFFNVFPVAFDADLVEAGLCGVFAVEMVEGTLSAATLAFTFLFFLEALDVLPAAGIFRLLPPAALLNT
jgi:hypothetical protein